MAAVVSLSREIELRAAGGSAGWLETQARMCTMDQVDVFQSRVMDDSLSKPGTLMWVSADAGSEFLEARQYCIAHAPQVAMRASVVEGLARPAAEVRAIVVTQSQRAVVSRKLIRDLQEAYPQARILCLMGACCEGMYAKVLDPVFSSTERVYCHQWAQVLPEWLRSCGAVVTSGGTLARSVAVVSATPAIGSALMDLAESAGAVTLWCRDICRWQMRQVDAVWWDDSVAHLQEPQRAQAQHGLIVARAAYRVDRAGLAQACGDDPRRRLVLVSFSAFAVALRVGSWLRLPDA